MALTLYGFHEHPDDIAATKTDAPLEECVFFLDFSRPLGKYRWCGLLNRWVGPVVGLEVPVVHLGEAEGAYVISVHRSDPFFADVIKMWRRHRGAPRTMRLDPVGGLEVIADFARHFPTDCQTV